MENLGIDPKLITAQIVSFVIFYLVFRKFVSHPLIKFLKKQKEQDELRDELALELEKRKETLDKKDREMDQKRKKEYEKALTLGKEQAKEHKVKLIAEAKKESEAIIIQAREQMEEEKSKMYKQIREKIADVSTLIVKAGLKDYLKPEMQKEVTKHILEQIPKVEI